MSGQALIWAANVRGLAPATKIVLIQLAERHNKDTGRCDPYIQKLAEDCEMSRASLMRHLATLEELGFITRVSQGLENGGRSSNQYDLHMPEAIRDKQRSQIETGGKGLISEGQRSQIEGAKVSIVRPPYSIEPVLNLKEPDALTRCDDLFSAEPAPTKKTDEVLAILIEVLPEQTAKDWVAHRKALKKTLTPQGARLLVGKLRDADNPVACVEASIMNGWQGVFPERSTPQQDKPHHYGGHRRSAPWGEVVR